MTDLAFNEKWKNIPRELLHIILKYDGKILYRSGGFYMNQIQRDEKRDKLLNKIPIKIYNLENNEGYFRSRNSLEARVNLSKKKWLFLRTLDNELYIFYMYLYKGVYHQYHHIIN